MESPMGTLESHLKMGMMGPGSERPKQPRRRKSITRLFSLSRTRSTKSKSRPTSPTSSMAYPHPQAPPTLPPSPTTLAKTSGYVSSGAAGRARSKSVGQSSVKVLQDLDTNVSHMSLSKEVEQEYLSIRDSGSTQSSKLVQNFSRHPRERKASLVSNGGKSSRNVSPRPASRASHQETRQISRSLQPRQSHEVLSFSRPFEPIAATPPIPELKAPAPTPRPQTAHVENFPSYVKELNPPLPRYGIPRHASVENLRTQRSPVVVQEQWATPWVVTDSEDEIRASMRSGVSDWSSGLESGSTKHSSVFTKMSSVSDMTEDTFDLDYGKDGMTVDDAIDLYCAGFEDDPEPTGGEQSPDTDDALTVLTSAKLAEAMCDSIDSVEDLLLPPNPSHAENSPTTASEDLLSPPKPSRAENSPTSAAILSGEIFRNIFPRPPELQQPTKTHDQYGFRKFSREVTTSQYDAWHSGYAKVQARRTSRWLALMKEGGYATKNPEKFPPRSAKVQRYIRKGMPPAWRGNMWFHYAGGQAFLDRYPDLYNELVVASSSSKLSSNDRESIERDLHRTFPDNIHFKPDPPETDGGETPLLSALRRVLSAFAIHHPRIGYCQSLNFIAGLLLVFLPEAKAFWMLHIITTRFLPGTHEVSLEGANVDLWVLMSALELELPSIWNKVATESQGNSSRLPPVSLCTTPWFMSLFIGTLPVESVLRVWDILFYEGSTTIFRVALGIFRLGEAEIRAVNDPMETFQVVQTLPRKMLDAGAVVTAACRKGSVGSTWVEKKRRERKGWYAAERSAERARRESAERMQGEEVEAVVKELEDAATSIPSIPPTPTKAVSVPNIETGGVFDSFDKLSIASASSPTVESYEPVRRKSSAGWLAKRTMSMSRRKRPAVVV